MNDDIKNSSAWLDDQRQQDDGFKLPDGYFDSLEDRVFSRIEAAGLQRKVPVLGRKKPAKRFALLQIFTAVAAVSILVLAAVWFMNPPTTLEQPIAAVELGEAEIETYLLENIHDFEEDQLAMLPQYTENEYQAPISKKPIPSTKALDPYEISTDDLDHILNYMTEEELEEIF